MNVTACRSCAAPIVWTETERGKHMPVDARPSLAGRFEIREGGPFTRPDGTQTEEGVPLAVFNPDAREVRYESHFATCPNAKGWRK